MSLMYIISVIFLNFLKLVDAKTCVRSDTLVDTFTCGMYEYCCGTRCCRSPIITFYQMWYFWLMVFLTILFCSGGGWWYRLRSQDTFLTPSMPTRTARTGPGIRHAQGPTIYPSGPTIYASSVPMPAAPNVAPYPPPPPYYGPPPSYDAVVNQNPILVPNPNQQIPPRQN